VKTAHIQALVCRHVSLGIPIFSFLLRFQHSTARGSVLGAILGAAHPAAVPFVDDLCAKDEIEKEVSALVDTIG
jgi:hypothetical protein